LHCYNFSMTKNEAAAEIARIYRNHAEANEWMAITTLAEYTDMTPAELAEGFKHLARTDDDFVIIPESNQKMLTEMDRLYAVRMGGQELHVFCFER
jgi:dTDP-4-amino-4,6-dideoxygalactose transaminase